MCPERIDEKIRKDQMKKINTNKKGFTIIEVVLVLAIAGLIFMMVFIALPALQRSQRDTQRSNDIARVQTALNQYQANNRGAIPSTESYVAGHDTPNKDVKDAKSTKSWTYFYDNYLIVNSGGAQDVFADPDGGFYSLWITDCAPKSKVTTEPCTNGQRYNVTFDDQSTGKLENDKSIQHDNKTSTNSDGSALATNHSISIIKNATCQGEVAYYSTGGRKVAILYKKEGGGTFCLNN